MELRPEPARSRDDPAGGRWSEAPSPGAGGGARRWPPRSREASGADTNPALMVGRPARPTPEPHSGEAIGGRIPAISAPPRPGTAGEGRDPGRPGRDERTQVHDAPSF